MSARIKIAIEDVWLDQHKIVKDDFFALIFEHFDVTLSEQPDILFFSVFGTKHKEPKYDRCIKVLYTGENISPKRFECDFSFSFEPTDKKNFFLPNFARFKEFDQLRRREFSSYFTALREEPKRAFCNFIYSNAKAKERQIFFQLLERYKAVDAPGRVLNNRPFLPSGYGAKMEYLSRYKFTMAFENERADYYTTEKIFHPFMVGSIPIYWGNLKVVDYFNPEAFINVNDFDSFEAAIEYIKEVDGNDVLYRRYCEAPAILSSSVLASLAPSEIITRLQTIFDQVGGCKCKKS